MNDYEQVYLAVLKATDPERFRSEMEERASLKRQQMREGAEECKRILKKCSIWFFGGAPIAALAIVLPQVLMDSEPNRIDVYLTMLALASPIFWTLYVTKRVWVQAEE